MVEFRLRNDGTPIFMEVNGRFWTSLPLAIYAGANFPALLAEMAEFGDVKTREDYRTGVRCRWILGDFRHLIGVMRGAPSGYPSNFPGRLRALRDFVTPHPGTYHDNFMLSDPMPELGDWLDMALRRLPRKMKKEGAQQEGKYAQRRYSHS